VNCPVLASTSNHPKLALTIEDILSTKELHKHSLTSKSESTII
jgi:hypothetical protein